MPFSDHLGVPMRAVSCRDWFNLEPHAKGRELMGLNVGFHGATYVMLADAPTTSREDNGIFARVRPKPLQTYVILAIVDNVLQRTIQIPPQDMNFHFAQPLTDGNLLLV